MLPRSIELAVEESSRQTCYDCHRPQAHCLCSEIRPVENRTSLMILQHPRERQHPFGTARLAEMGLRRVEVLVDHQGRLRKDPGLGQQLDGYGLLYPHPNAVDLSELAPEQRPKKLVVLDGTWRHAHQMYRDIACLRSLPHYSLPQGLVSGFQIRKQPALHCLSTLEAIHFALQCLEPDTPGLDEMLRPFQAMQAKQLVAMQGYSPRRKKSARSSGGMRLPAALRNEFASLVIVYGELSTAKASGGPRQIVALAAERPASGERLRIVLKQAVDDERHLRYMRLGPQDLQAALSGEDFRAAWQAFARPGDVWGAWNKGTLELLERDLPVLEQGPVRGPGLILKTLYLNLRRARGSLEQIVVAEGLLDAADLEHNQLRLSRAEERLASVLALVRFLHESSGPR